MDKQFEAVYHTLEDENWWFKARQDFVLRLLERYRIPREAAILDIGCGGGGLLQFLAGHGYGRTYGIDNSPEAIAFCNSRRLASVRLADAKGPLDFPDKFFDFVIASDVLEHIEDSGSALREWKRIIRDGGRLLIFVPAFQALWSHHDVLNKHSTRYTRKRLLALAAREGLEPLRWSYWNFFMFVPYFFVLRAKKLFGTSPIVLKQNRSVVNSILKQILIIENRLILGGARLPFGVSCMAVFEKKE